MFDLAGAWEGSALAVDAWQVRQPARRREKPALHRGEEDPKAVALALRLTSILTAMAGFTVDMQLSNSSTPGKGPGTLLAGLRLLHAEISGERSRAFREFVAEFAPSQVVSFDRAHESASRNLAELRAFMAVVCDEDDDDQLGIDVLPEADWDDDEAYGPSVSSFP